MTDNIVQEPTSEEQEARQRLEIEAGADRKLSDRVRVHRLSSAMGPVFGPPIFMLDLDQTAENLAISGFMRPWICEQIKRHLLEGGTFCNKGMTAHDDEPSIKDNGQVLGMVVRSEYRLASISEVLNYVDTADCATITGHKISARAQEKKFLLHYHEGPRLIELYDRLPRQARTILDLLNETERDNFTAASIEIILTNGIDALKTRQEPSKIFAFYQKRLLDEGHLEEIDT